MYNFGTIESSEDNEQMAHSNGVGKVSSSYFASTIREHGYSQTAVLPPHNIQILEGLSTFADAANVYTIELYICVLSSKHRRCTRGFAKTSALGSRNRKYKTQVAKCRCGCLISVSNAAIQLLTFLDRQIW